MKPTISMQLFCKLAFPQIFRNLIYRIQCLPIHTLQNLFLNNQINNRTVRYPLLISFSSLFQGTYLQYNVQKKLLSHFHKYNKVRFRGFVNDQVQSYTLQFAVCPNFTKILPLGQSAQVELDVDICNSSFIISQLLAILYLSTDQTIFIISFLIHSAVLC